MVNKYTSIIVDIGARYGEHPTWKKFKAEKKVYLIEADKKEALRLKKKYKKLKNYKVFPFGISGKEKSIKIRILNNPAMSGTKIRNNVSPMYWGQRINQPKKIQSLNIKSITLDEFLRKNNINPDFIKLDTEGSEYEILKNSKKIFKTLLGVRCEVSFLDIFKGEEKNGSFNNLHKLFVNNGLSLLNLDYDGKADYFSDLISPNEKYGMLQSCDAVWIKDPSKNLKIFTAEEILKLSCFLFLNNAPDVAIWILKKSHNNKKIFLMKKTKIFNFCKVLLIKHLYKLKWIPNQKLNTHKKIYESIFRDKFPEKNKYNESEILNPI